MSSIKLLLFFAPAIVICSPSSAQAFDDLFDDYGNLKLESMPTIINLAREYFYTHPVIFDATFSKNMESWDIFFTQIQANNDFSLLTDTQKLKLTKAVYSQYYKLVYESWNIMLEAKYSITTGGAKFPICDNYQVGSVWEVFWRAYNEALLQGKSPGDASQAALTAVRSAFPCYKLSNYSGGSYRPADPLDFDQIWGWFVAALVV